MKKLMCFIWGHHYFVIREMKYHRKVGCYLCPSEWGMMDSIQSFVPWDKEFEEIE